MTFSRISHRRTAVLTAVLAALCSALVGLSLAKGGGPAAAEAADHLDAPGLTPPGGDVRADITDVYAFRRGAKSVLVANVNGLTRPGRQATFASSAPSVRSTRRVSYNFHVDNDGDAVADTILAVTFGRPGARGVQPMTVRRNGRLLVSGRTSPYGRVAINRRGRVKSFAGMRDDPFFFDLNGFINILSSEPGESFLGCSGRRPDFFARTNVSSIVLELPSALLTRRGTSDIGVWVTTKRGRAQIDRMGRPAIATVFIPNNPFEPTGSEPSLKNAYNHARPRNDQGTFRGEVVDTLTVLHSLNNSAGDDPADDAMKVNGLADVLLPDILTFDTASSAGFLNGRRLADDVIDAELALVTEGAATTDCVGANDRRFLSRFPYLAGPHGRLR
jgi:hypothetical protein